MSRLPPLPRDQLPADGQKVHDQLHEAFKPSFARLFTIKRDSDDALLGPVPAFLANPAVGDGLLAYMGGLSKLSGLTPEARETVILAVGSHYKAAYELYAHVNVAVKSTGLTATQAEQIAQGKKPSDLDDACSIAFDASLYLASTPGPLSQTLWDRSVEVLGKDGTVSLLHYAGFYAYTCILLNGIDAPVPQQ